MNQRPVTTPRWLRRAWLELRFMGLAFLQFDLHHPRVQRVIDEKMELWRAG